MSGDELMCGCGYGPPHPAPWTGSCDVSRGRPLGHTPKRHRLLHLGLLAAQPQLTGLYVGNRWLDFFLRDRQLSPETANEIRLCIGHGLMHVQFPTAKRSPVTTLAAGYDVFHAWRDEHGKQGEMDDSLL